MAIATLGGHVSRAIDFYNAVGKYFVIGGTVPWEDEVNPPTPILNDFKLVDVVGLKRVDEKYLVVPDVNGDILYRDNTWRKILPVTINTTVGELGVPSGSTQITLASIANLVAASTGVTGTKLRVNNLYEGRITNITGLTVTLDTAAPTDIPAGSPVLGGALVEGAKYVYVKCSLRHDQFPVRATNSQTNYSYRQVGFCTGVTPNSADILRAAGYGSQTDEFTSLGTLEILDNRLPSTRYIDQEEELSLIIEF